MVKRKNLRSLKYEPLFWGIIFLGLIPIFAVIYMFLPIDWFVCANQCNYLNNFGNSLYFSTITLTTLGYGDIYPVNLWAKALVIVESLAGILSIGLFLNAVAVKKGQIDTQVEKQKAKEQYVKNETIKLCRQFVILEPYIYNFIQYSTIVSTPVAERAKALKYNPEFDFHDLCDLYKSTMRLSDDFNMSAISFFYQALHGLENRVEDTLKVVDFSIWPKLEKNLITVLRSFREYDFESSIRSVERMRFSDGVKGVDAMAQLIKDWKEKIDFFPSNSINYYVGLYKLIKAAVPNLQEFQENMIEISKSNEEENDENIS